MKRSSTRRSAAAVAIVVSLAGAAGVARADTLAVTFSGAFPGNNALTDTAGFSFTTTEAITVTSLDATLGTAASEAVRLYNASGTTLGQAIVTSTDPTESTDGFTYGVQSISPVVLAAKTTYFVAADIEMNHGNVPIIANSVTTETGVTYGTGVLAANSTGSNPTSDADHGANNPGYFAADFGFTPGVVSSTPLPKSATAGLSLLGLLGLIRLRRRPAGRAAVPGRSS